MVGEAAGVGALGSGFLLGHRFFGRFFLNGRRGRGGAGAGFAAAAAFGAAALGGAAPPSRERIGWPTEILSPTETMILVTLPAAEEGTGRDGFAGFQFDDALAFRNLIAFLDQNADNTAGVNAFAQRR